MEDTYGLDVLLVRPVINRRRNAPFFLPLGLLCVASPLRNAGLRVDIVDLEYQYRAGRLPIPDGDAGWLDYICGPLAGRRPRLVGLTALADTLPVCLMMGAFIKDHSPGTKVAIGGPGVFGTFPAVLERFGDCLDYLCMNEGEMCMLELAERLKAGESAPVVAGFHAVGLGGTVLEGPKRPLSDINEMPMPAYDLLPVPEYLELASPRIFDVYLGSGCTYACKFCVTAEFWERDFRSKAPDVVLRELDYLYENYGIVQVNFLHDNFANRKRYLEDFIDHFLAHNTRYQWGCAVRPDNVTRDQLARMKRAGCFNVFCGTDAGSARVLRQMAKMRDASRSYQFFSNCRDVGLPFETNTILGYPDETDGELEDSLRLIFSAVAHGAINSDVSVLQPLPGAAVTRDYGDYLEPVSDNHLGTFLPADALALVAGNPQLFSGFSFIRHGNREHSWYGALGNLVRFFNRHFFRTLYLLAEGAHFRYIDLLEPMLDTRDPAQFGDRFQKLVAGLDLPPELADLVLASLSFDAAEERLRHIDVNSEVENVYTPATALDGGRLHQLEDLPMPVHRVFAHMPELDMNIPAQPTTYLWVRDEDSQVQALCLRNWQRGLLERLEQRSATQAYLDELTDVLSMGHDMERDSVRSAVAQALDILTRVLDTGRPLSAHSSTSDA